MKIIKSEPVEDTDDFLNEVEDFEISLEEIENNGKDASFNCTDCAQSFQSKKELRDHNTLQHDVPKYHCDRCEKVFTKSKKLALHQAVEHRTVKDKFLCTICTKEFKGKAIYSSVRWLQSSFTKIWPEQ